MAVRAIRHRPAKLNLRTSWHILVSGPSTSIKGKMDQEFKRMSGNIAISNQGFEVSVITGRDVSVEYKESGRQAYIPAERVMNGGIGLFMDWAKFPDGASAEEQRSIFERVIRALWFMEIPIGEIEINPAQNKWPLPPRPAR